jgi:3-oxoacyl-[acyl-carrier protein] reductase
MIDAGLTGRVAIVTGANHGIGAAIARALAAEGVRVLLTFLRLPMTDAVDPRVEAGEGETPGEARYALHRANTAEDVVQPILEQGGEAVSWEAHLSDPGAFSPLFDHAEATFGPVEVLVNNAAHWESDTLQPSGMVHEAAQPGSWSRRVPITVECHDRHFAVNSRAVALLMGEFARRHVDRGADWGRIINVSTDGASGFAGEVSYGASKHAMESYSRAAAHELRKLGITVNVVSPGPIQTGYIAPELEQRLAGFVGQPEEIADVIVFLASHQARWLTGQLLYVGAGHVMPL